MKENYTNLNDSFNSTEIEKYIRTLRKKGYLQKDKTNLILGSGPNINNSKVTIKRADPELHELIDKAVQRTIKNYYKKKQNKENKNGNIQNQK